MKTKCEWTTGKTKKPCIRWNTENSKYCIDHLYVDNYTDTEKANSKYCSECRKVVYIEEGYKICESSRQSNVEKKKKIKEKNKNPTCPGIVVGTGEICGNKIKENGYCDQHSRFAIRDEILKDPSKKICSNFNRKYCANSLDKNSPFSKCDVCREKENK